MGDEEEGWWGRVGVGASQTEESWKEGWGREEKGRMKERRNWGGEETERREERMERRGDINKEEEGRK